MSAGVWDADALTINFSGTSTQSGNPLSASAEFLVSGTQLTIILTNTMNSAATNGADVLDAIYFDIAGAKPVMSNGQASLTTGSDMVMKNNAPAGPVNPFNNEWMFKSPNATASREYSIGCTGAINFNTNADTFDRVFHGGTANAGANDDYGLVPTAGITAGNNTNVYARNSMTFVFDMDRTITESDIQNAYVTPLPETKRDRCDEKDWHRVRRAVLATYC